MPKALEALLRGMIGRELTPCATLAVANGSGPLYSFLEGRAATGGGAPAVDETTRFNIGSMTKPVTASLIMKLAEEGALTLSDPVRKHIRRYPFEQVTLHHLMTHTAGYDEAIDRAMGWPRSEDGLPAYLEAIYSIPALKYEPGAVAAYCTQGYTILMDVIERVAGCSLEAFARKTLFEPLGMERTTFLLSGLREGEYALPWKKRDEHCFDYLRHTPPTGDTGLYSTAADMLRFAMLFLNGGRHEGKRIFSRATVDCMLRESTGMRFLKTPAFWVRGSGPSLSAFGDLNAPDAVGHAGFSGTFLMIDPPHDIAMAFITNSNDLHDDYAHFRLVCNAVLSAFT